MTRRRQRARTEEAYEEHGAQAAGWYRVASWLLPGVQPATPPWEVEPDIRPYRGFRAGRARIRPDSTGFGDPVSPDREQWDEPRADDPTLDPIIGDCDDEPWTPR
jgi:hypothetical protein